MKAKVTRTVPKPVAPTVEVVLTLTPEEAVFLMGIVGNQIIGQFSGLRGISNGIHKKLDDVVPCPRTFNVPQMHFTDALPTDFVQTVAKFVKG